MRRSSVIGRFAELMAVGEFQVSKSLGRWNAALGGLIRFADYPMGAVAMRAMFNAL